jgi:hypothetical protein
MIIHMLTPAGRATPAGALGRGEKRGERQLALARHPAFCYMAPLHPDRTADSDVALGANCLARALHTGFVPVSRLPGYPPGFT